MQPINWKYSYSSGKRTHFCPCAAWVERFSTSGCQGHRSKLLTFLQGHITFKQHTYSVRSVVIRSNVKGASAPSWPLRTRREATVDFPHGDEFGWDPVSPAWEQPSEGKGVVLGFVHHVLPVPGGRTWSDPAELPEMRTLPVHLLSTLRGRTQAVCKNSCLLYLSHWLV